jgi:flagellar biosynthesis protein FlhF
MRIKSYFVRSVDEAIAQARVELGEDALLLNTRKENSPGSSWSGYEVVFGCVDDQAGPARVEAAPPAAMSVIPAATPVPAAPVPTATSVPAGPPVPASFSAGSLASTNLEAATDLEQLRSQIDEIHSLLLAAGSQRAASRGLSFLDRVFARLMKAGWSATLAGSIVDRVAAALSKEVADPGTKAPVSIGRKVQPSDETRLQELLREELSARVKIDASLGAAGSEGAVVAMVGPGGSGKTSMLMKIAAFQAAPTRPVRLLTLDRSGLGSRMHLQMFARKTRIAFTPVESPEALPALIEEARKKEIVLIDTPGYLEPADRSQLASVLTRCPGVDVHLVLPAYMTSSACREAIRRYSLFWPSKMAVTRFDETASFGALVPEAAEAGLSLSLVTDGVSIPDSLHAFSVEDLMNQALGRESLTEAACA